MKDSAISYDLIHHQHHHQQSQQPHQQHTWNQQRQQQLQTHTTSIYSNHQHLHQATQQSSHSRQPQQQQTQQHDTQLGQYSHQQLQSAAAAAAAVAAHHNATNNAAAYYQQAAHLYPTYHGQQDQQQQQQQTMQDHHAHQHASTSVSTPNSAATSVLNAAVVAAAQQHAASGTPAGSALNHHTGWSPAGVGALTAAATAAHHAVVTDHSTLAYITHAYQSHGTSAVNDHHRNSTGPLASQSIGSAAQTPTYTVDTLYNTPAAVAAYGYNNYNAAFFQTSNNGPHAQTGHPSQASLSTFWNQTTQHQQQRTTHSQTMSSQAAASLQQRQQQLASNQSNNYLHDPRIYAYGRPPFTQNATQSFGLHQHTEIHQHQQQVQQQVQQQQPHHHQRMSANLSQQHSLQQHQSDQSPQPISHQLGQQTASLSTHQSALPNNAQHGQPHIEPENRKVQSSLRASPQQQQVQKQQNDIDLPESKLKFDHRTTNQLAQQQQQQQKATSATKQHSVSSDEVDCRNKQIKVDQVQSSNHQNPSTNSVSPTKKSQSVMKSETQSGQYQSRKDNMINSPPQQSVQQAPQGARNIYRVPQEDRAKSQAVDTPSKKFTSEPIETRTATNRLAAKSNQSSLNVTNKQQESTDDQATSLEDNMATLSIGPRKTTWASIASQPAKVSQPKSLKSKIAGSNSVLSSTNKHLTTSVTIDSSSLDTKNGINPAIKNSVSTAATSMSRGPTLPQLSKVSSVAIASLKLDLLGEDGTDSKISWPAVNASINLTLEDTLPQKSSAPENDSISNNNNDRLKRDNGYKARDTGRDTRDHNHNQGSKFINFYPHRDECRQEDWHRREPREYRSRRDSDRKVDDADKRISSVDHHEDLRDHLSNRRDFKQSNRGGSGHSRQPDETSFRDFKRGGPVSERKDNRNTDNYRFPASGRGSDQSRDMSHRGGDNSRQHTDSAPHHHYDNLRDGSHIRNQQPTGKMDLSVHPHLNPDNFNPKTFDCEPESARFFIIKSYSEDDIHRSIKYSVWCSTNHGNRRLDEAYRQQQACKGQLYLFFSVNGSGHFCGMAQMTSNVDFESSSGIWALNKWQGEFNVKWIYVKDVPNSALRHITLENNEDKPVTNSRDTQEVPNEKGKAVLKIIHQYSHQTSLFDDFLHYERRQEEEKAKKSSQMDHHLPGPPIQRDHERLRASGGGSGPGGNGRFGRPYVNARPHNDRPSRYS